MPGQEFAKPFNICFILTVCRCFLSIIGVFTLLGSFSFAADSAPGSESSFGYFLNDDGARSDLHDAFYSPDEIAIVEEYKAQLSLPRSREKDELIAGYLAKEIRYIHQRLFMKDLGNPWCLMPLSSLPDNNNLRDIVMHALDRGKFFGFGHNRTFEALLLLKWVDKNKNITAASPGVFKKTWQEARANR